MTAIICYNQGVELMQEKRYHEALAVLRRAAKENPKGRFLEMQAWVFIQKGEELVKNAEWEKALAVVEPGLQKLAAGPRDLCRSRQLRRGSKTHVSESSVLCRQ